MELHIEKGLVESKIAIFRGKGSENNMLILEALALKGSLIKYDLFKALKESRKEIYYPTISRRVDNLLSRGYLEPVGKRIITVGKRKEKSSKYGLSWKGLIASFTIKSVPRNVIRVLKKNPHLKLPFPRKVTLRIIREIFTDRELEIIGQALVTGYLKAIPKDLESLKPEQYVAYLLPAMTEVPQIQEEFKEKDLSRLLQIPEVLDFVSKLLNNTEKMLEEMLLNIREFKKSYLESEEDKSTQPIVVSKRD